MTDPSRPDAEPAPEPTESSENGRAVQAWQAGDTRQAQRILDGWLADHPRALYPLVNRQLLALALGETAPAAVLLAWQRQMQPAYPEAERDPQVAAFLAHVAGSALQLEHPVTALLATPDGRWLLMGLQNGEIKRHDLTQGTTHSLPPPLEPGSNEVLAMALREGTRELVVCHRSGFIRVWDLATDLPLQLLEGPSCWADQQRLADPTAFRPPSGMGRGFVLWDTRFALTRDGQRALLSWDRPGSVLWDLRSGRLVRSLVGTWGRDAVVALSADGGLALAAAGGSCGLWSLGSGGATPVHALATQGEIRVLALSPDGRRAATAGPDRLIQLWDARTGQPGKALGGHTESVRFLSFSADGDKLLSGSDDRTLRVWDCESGRCLRTLSGHGDRILAGILLPGDLPVSSAQDKTVFLWKEPAGACPPLLHAAPPQGSRDVRRRLLDRARALDGAACDELRALAETDAELRQDPEVLTVLHQAGRRTSVPTGVQAAARVGSIDLTRDPKVLAAARDTATGVLLDSWGGVLAFDLTGGAATPWPAIEPRPEALACSPDGTFVLTGGGRFARLWRRGTGELVATLEHPLPVCGVGFSADATRLWTATREEPVLRVFDVASRAPIGTPIRPTAPIQTAEFSPSGDCLLVIDARGQALWDVQSGQPLRTLGDTFVGFSAATFSADGRALVAVTSRGVSWLDTASGQATPSVSVEGRYPALAPGGQILATVTDAGTRKLRIAATATGRVLHELDLGTERVSMLAWSGDGQHLLAASFGRLLIFRIQYGWAAAEDILDEAERIVSDPWPPQAPLALWPQLAQVPAFEAYLTAWQALRRLALRPDLSDALRTRLTELDAEMPDELRKAAFLQLSPFMRTALPPAEPRRRAAHPVYRAGLVDEGIASALAQAMAQALPGPAKTRAKVLPAAPAPAPATDEAAPDAAAAAAGVPLPGFAELYQQLVAGGGSALKPVLATAAQLAERGDDEGAWGEFLCRQSSLIGQGGAEALLQRALAEQPGSPVLAMARALVASGAVQGGILRALRPLGPVPGAPGHRTLLQHRDALRAAQALPDGQRALVALGNEVLVLNAVSGVIVGRLPGHGSAVCAVAVDATGTLVASADQNGELRLWDLRTCAHLRTLADTHRGTSHLLFTPDGERLIGGGDGGSLKIWALPDGALLHSNAAGRSSTSYMLLHPGGELLLTRADRTVRVWELRTGQCLQSLTGDLGDSDVLALFGDGVRAVFPTYGGLVIWDLAAGTALKKFRYEGDDRVQAALLVLPDQRHLVAAHGNHTIGIWDLETGELKQRFAGHTRSVTALSLLADGRRALTASHDGTLRVWDLAAAAPAEPPAQHQQSVSALATAPAAPLAVSASDDQTLRLWDTASGQAGQVLRLSPADGTRLGVSSLQSGGVREILLHPDGRRAVTRSDNATILIWDLHAGTCLRALPDHSRRVSALALHPDGSRLVSGGEDGAVKVWTLETGTCLATLSEHSEAVSALVLLDGGERVAAGYADGSIRIWDLAGKQVTTRMLGQCHTILALWREPQLGTLIAVDDQEYVVRWDVQTGAAVGMSSPGLRGIKRLPDGEHFLGTKYDGEIQLVRAGDGQLLRSLKGHGERAAAVALHPSQPLALSAGPDRTARLWHLHTGACLAVFHADAALTACAIQTGAGPDTLILGAATGQVVLLAYEPAQPGTLAVPVQAPAAPEAPEADPPQGADWHALRGLLTDRRDGLLWLPGTGARCRELLSLATGSDAPAPFGPQRGVAVRLVPLPHTTCRQQLFRQLADGLRDVLEAPAPAAPTTTNAPELTPDEQLEQQVRAVLSRLLSGRVVIALEGLDTAVAEDPDFLVEALARVQAPRVLLVCAGQPTEALQAALRHVSHAQVAELASPSEGTPEPDELAVLLASGQTDAAIARVTSLSRWMALLDQDDAVARLALDLRRVQAALPDPQALAPWVAFLKRHRLALSRGRGTALLQLALAEADDSPVTQAAEAWNKAAPHAAPWLRRLHRPAAGLADPIRAVLAEHKRAVRSLSLDQTGQRLLSSAEDGTVRLWDLASGHATARLTVPDVKAVRLTGEPARIIAIQKLISEWDPATDNCVRRVRTPYISQFVIAPDLRWIGILDWRQLELWDLNRLTRLRAIEGFSSRAESLLASPDSRHVVVGFDDRIVRCWDVETGACAWSTAALSSVARLLLAHPDGQRLVVVCEKELVLCDLATGATLSRAPAELPFEPRGCLSADGKTLLLSRANQIYVHDLETGARTGTLVPRDSSITALQLHPDGTSLLTGHDDGTICVVAPPQRPARSEPLPRGVTALAVEPQDRALSLVTAEDLQHWDVATLAQTDALFWPQSRARLRSVFPQHNLGIALEGQNTIELWDLAADEKRQVLSGHTAMVRALSLSVQGDRLVSIGYDGLRVWDVATGTCVARWEGLPDDLKAVWWGQIALLPDGKSLLAGPPLRRGPAKRWDLETRTFTEVPQLAGSGSFALDAAGQRLAAVSRSEVEIFALPQLTRIAAWSPAVRPSLCALGTAGLLGVVDEAGALTCLQLEAGGPAR